MSAPGIRGALVGLVLALLVTAGQSAQPVEPQPAGPVQITPALSLAVSGLDGNLLKASRGLFRSTDRGARWSPISLPAGLHPDRIRQVATTAAAPSSLYAAGPGAGVVRSDDNGRTWRSISAGLPSQEVAALAVHSFRPDTIFVSVPPRGVFRTEDSGRRWQKMDDGPHAPVVALAHSPLEGSMNTGWLYAATPRGPYLSMDCF